MASEPNLDSIFGQAIEIDSASERAAFLDEVCKNNHDLRGKVDKLLQAHEAAGCFMADGTETLDHALPAAGMMIGPYKLREKLGEGGMGVVWAAEQVRSVQRKVALKVIKPGMDSEAIIARFEAERQALALMDHPNIARVLDAGTTDQGTPYFVMELIRGVPVTEYCDSHKLSIPERLHLFMQICRAVQHAHQKGIIHRDIKPSNVLVTLHDGEPVPKVIDFGVAKALNQKLTDKTIYTRVHQAIGTLAYMSPEQAELSGLDVDTRADVYALGVLLYELLTGTTPFEQRRLHEAAYHEACRIIRDEEPPRPSTRLSSLGATATTVAAKRRSDVTRLGAIFRGELDWIVMRALEKNRTRRYESAADFSKDVDRYLRNEPVSACPPSAAYRFKKFASKNRAWLVTAGLVCASLITGTTIATWQAIEASRVAAELKQSMDERSRIEGERQGALRKYQDELFMRALTAVLAGAEENTVEALIKEATDVAGAPPTWEAKIRAQMHLYNGDVEAALAVLHSSVDENPADVGALALLALAYLDYGDHKGYLIYRQKLVDVKEAITSLENFRALPEDWLLVAEAEMFGDIAAGVETIKSVIAESPTPLALAFLCEAHMKLHYGSGCEDTRDMALAELHAVKQLMPRSAYVARLDFWLNFILLTQGDESPARRAAVKDAVERFATFPTYPAARHARACYFDFMNEPDKARREWQQLGTEREGVWMEAYFAAFEYRHGNRKDAIDILRQSSPKFAWTQIYLAEALALDGREAEARAIYESVVREIEGLRLRPDDFVSIPEGVLLLLGDQGEATRRVEKRLNTREPLPWPKGILAFIANPEMDPEELLSSISGDAVNYNLVVAHKLIAFRHLCRGEVELAEEFLNKSKNACAMQPDAYWAGAFLSRLQTDDDLRERIKRRRTEEDSRTKE